MTQTAVKASKTIQFSVSKKVTVMKKEQTLGEFRTGTSFNPSYKSTIDEIRVASAALIDLIAGIPDYPDKDYSDEHRGNGDLRIRANYERGRVKDLAMRKVEEAAMWAIKAATKE